LLAEVADAISNDPDACVHGPAGLNPCGKLQIRSQLVWIDLILLQTKKRVRDCIATVLSEAHVACRDHNIPGGPICLHPVIGDLLPAGGGEADVGPVRARAQHAGAPWVPPEEKQIVRSGRSGGRGIARSPGYFETLIETQGLADVFLDL
jgi:hypothetical protein